MYNLEILLWVRGSISRHASTWLARDFIQGYPHRLSDSLSQKLQELTFFMPVFERDPSCHGETFSIDVFIERLRLEKHTILSADKEDLASSVLCDTCNVTALHWISLKVTPLQW